jgi:hypothetical protein
MHQWLPQSITTQMLSKTTAAALLFGLICTPFQLSAKVIYEQFELTPESTIRIEGSIGLKDLTDFKAALQKLDEAKKSLHMGSVQLNSRGGSGFAARGIGRLIRERKFNTYLAEDSSCASACVDILIAGVQRYAFGKVRVHRSTFIGDSVNDDEVAGFVDKSRNTSFEYVRSMGVSAQLAEAMETTESWRMRELSELEKQQWQVFGTDRVAEETLLNQIARSRYISREEFIDIFTAHYQDCLDQAREFKTTVYDCAKSLNHKPLSWLDRGMNHFVEWLNRLSGVDQLPAIFIERVEFLEDKIRFGSMYKRPMLIKEIPDISYETTAKVGQASKSAVAQMEKANVWWVSRNKLNILLKNPTDRKVQKIVFTLSELDCKSAGKKRVFAFELLAPLENERPVIYSGEFPVDYLKAIGKGARCGEIEAALY